MQITAKNILDEYPNLNPKIISRITRTKDWDEDSKVYLPEVAELNDKKISIFCSGMDPTLVNYIKDDKMRTEVADAAGVKSENPDTKGQNNNNLGTISMDTSIFDIEKEKKLV